MKSKPKYSRQEVFHSINMPITRKLRGRIWIKTSIQEVLDTARSRKLRDLSEEDLRTLMSEISYWQVLGFFQDGESLYVSRRLTSTQLKNFFDDLP